MWYQPLIQGLHDGRLHMQHGPIDVVLKAWGTDAEVTRAHDAAIARFQTLLSELTGELDELRLPMSDNPYTATAVGLRMTRACALFPEHFITPMAAVAGAVADELIAAMTAAAQLDKAYVNDGGDIAVHLMQGQTLGIGVMADFSRMAIPERNGAIILSASDPVRGIASSGARGRSFSLGISDSVTVLAATAAVADAAATLVANAVNLDRPDIVRKAAVDLDPDNDLGEQLVTVSVPKLTEGEISDALSLGLAVASGFRTRGLIIDAALALQGQIITLGPMLQLHGKFH
jgi:uncharacterized protein